MNVQMATPRPWEEDMAWGRRFTFHMAAICGAYLIREAPWEEDAYRNTDLIVLTVPSGLRVACRVRRPQFLHQYPHEFTIRCERKSKAETELRKVLRGWGDYILYGFADPESERPRLKAWLLGNLDVFRDWYSIQTDKRDREPGTLRHNSDGSSDFVAFRIDELPPAFVVARQFQNGQRVAA